MGVERMYTSKNQGLDHIKALSCCESAAEGALFTYQSPIDFSDVPKVQRDPSLAIAFDYSKQHFDQAIFANAYHLVPSEKKSAILFETERYWLIDIHVHFPSEHLFDHQHAEFEIHFVHESQRGQKLVIGVLYNTASTGYLVKNELRRFQIMGEFEARAPIFFNPRKYLPREQSFYHFVGSLTTAPYDGPVLWFVMDTIQLANKAMVERAKKIIPTNNNRAVFPLKDRQIWHN